jgi:phosphate transport system substrate-binding protein
MRKTAGILAAAAIAASALIATPAHAVNTITAGGSSFSGGLITLCAANYTAATVTYNPEGSGPGRSKFNLGTYDFGGSDAAYAATDAKPADLAYVPLLGGPVALAFNVSGLTNLRIDAKTTGAIFQGTITKWNDPAIAKLNPGVKLPATAITPIYRGGSSGTNDNFSNYLAQNGATGFSQSGTWSTATGKSAPAGTSSATSSAVVSNIKSTEGAFGYVDLKDAITAGLNYAALKNGAGQFVKPTAAGAAKFISAQEVNANGTITFNFTKSVPGAYQASLVTYGLVHTTASAKSQDIKNFLSYMVNSCVPANATKLGYVALTGAVKAKAVAILNTIK